MKVFCLTQFKTEFEKLLKSNSYKDLEKQIIDFFLAKLLLNFSEQERD